MEEEKKENGDEEYSLENIFFNDLVEYVEIPIELYETETSKPFSTCKKCKQSLNDKHYSIQKVFEKSFKENKSKLYLEFAICNSCMESFDIEISKESRKKIDQLFEKVFDNDAFTEIFATFPEEEDIPVMVSNCLLKCRAIGKNEGYAVSAFFKGDKMVLTQSSPAVISEEGMEMLKENLSASTKDEMDKMYDMFDLPTELKDITLSPLIIA
jgi:hypothetical protein